MEEAVRIVLVEDDEVLAKEICSFLKRWGYQAFAAGDFQHIDKEYLRYRPHLILMDINLPFYDGFYWCTNIRRHDDVPIIFISSRSDDRDKIMGIAQGGDDYVEKPFRLELLKAKIEAILRRTYQYKVKEQCFLSQELSYERHSSSFYYQKERLELTKSENRIVSVLIEHRGTIVSRSMLMEALWNTDEFISDNSLSVLISRLRSKLVAFCGKEIIETRKGKGYLVE